MVRPSVLVRSNFGPAMAGPAVTAPPALVLVCDKCTNSLCDKHEYLLELQIPDLETLIADLFRINLILHNIST